MAKKINNNWLIFVDTNIFLDFYRKDGWDAVKQIEALARHKDKLIITDQVFMEFLKNRQTVISATIKELKKPDTIKLPPILRDSTSAEILGRDLQSVTERFNKVSEKVRKILTEPKKYDEVFKGISQLFEASGSFSLNRENSSRHTIRRFAQKRFFLGYPPRKSGDTSIGDALNWEWVIKCAQTCPNSSHIMIVSRDGDFGYKSDQISYLNDWLVREFKERAGKERKIVLTARLTDALKKLNETVSKAEIDQESKIIETVDLNSKNDLLRFLRGRNVNGYLALDSAMLAAIGTSQDDKLDTLNHEGFDVSALDIDKIG